MGELLIRSLMRAAAAARAAPRGGLRLPARWAALLFALVPATRNAQVLGVALPWLVLGGLVYPTLVAGGWLYVRLAERNERDFVELVERS